MAGIHLNKRGQSSVEFILIVTIGLLYIHMAAWPLINDATASAEDVKRVSDTKVAAIKLADSINEAAAGSGESKKTLHLFVPERAVIECDAITDSANPIIKFRADVEILRDRQTPVAEAGGVGCSRETPDPDNLDYEVYRCKSIIALLQAPSNCAQIGESIPDSHKDIDLSGPLLKAVVVKRDADGDISVEWG